MKRNWTLIAVLAVLAAVYVYSSDWFKPQTVSIYLITRDLPSRFQRGGTTHSLNFILGRALKLTEIKLVPLTAYQADPKTLPLWHLISDSNSVPVKNFFYGQYMRGLRPAVPGTSAQPLTNNVTYRLIVTAGRFKGEHDFQLQ